MTITVITVLGTSNAKNGIEAKSMEAALDEMWKGSSRRQETRPK